MIIRELYLVDLYFDTEINKLKKDPLYILPNPTLGTILGVKVCKDFSSFCHHFCSAIPFVTPAFHVL